VATEPGPLASADRLIDAEPRPDDLLPGPVGRLRLLCSALARSVAASAVGVSVLTDDPSSGGTVAAWGSGSGQLEDLQFTLGEGPCLDAYALRRPVLEPDLLQGGIGRWPGYALAAQDHGVRAVFAFPLQLGAARAGALAIYRDHPGSLSADAMGLAFSCAALAMQLVLDSQAGVEAGRTSHDLDDALAYRLEVYQAQGMVKVDLGVSLDEALARLRAHAYASGRPLSDIARDIVAGTLMLGDDQP
jgi:hypothetical protein